MQSIFPHELVAIPNYEQIKSNFVQELINAKEGKDSSLSFIKHHLPDKSIITNGIVQAIVIGGTNYILSTVEIGSDGTRNVLDRQTGVLPMIQTAATLFSFLQKHFDPRAMAIGINFGFPLGPITGSHGELDGTLLSPGKEHAMIDLIGKTIGKEVATIFKAKYGHVIPVTAANDTVCLILAGDGSEDGSIIAGTGFNIGLKLTQGQKSIIVNLETASFDKFEQSDILKKIDAQSEKPGHGLFQKIISGKYLTLHFNETIKQFNLPLAPVTSSHQLTQLAQANPEETVGQLAQAILERSACLVATTVASVYEFLNRPPKLILNGEGRLLWEGWQYSENLKKQLRALSIPHNIIEFRKIQDSSINGAIGLLTHSSNNQPGARL